MNEITYNGKNLSDFGVYYDSHSAFGSPERDVELVEVAGKNGALIIDNDRFRNIDLTFPCYINTNFLAQYRNALAYLQSCKGYNRLEYSQEPNHFRMASFNMGSQPTPNQFHKSGQFPLVFNCKPQRFLKSGETPVSSQSQDEEYEGNPAVINNPSGLSNVKSLEVGLEPIQNLNGYESPWVGGANFNLLPNGIDGTYENNGLKVVAKGGVYTITGTTTASATVHIPLATSFDMSPSTNNIAFFNNATGSVDFGFERNGTRIHYWGMNSVNRTINSWTDSGNEVVDGLHIYSGAGNTLNLTVSPVFFLKTNTYPTAFTPYANICPIYGYDVKNVLTGLITTDGTQYDVTYKANADGTYTVNGTNSYSSVSDYRLSGQDIYRLDLPVGDYIINGGVDALNGTSNTLYLGIKNGNDNTSRYVGTKIGDTAFSIASGEYISSVFIRMASGATASNAVFKPMIRDARIADDTFVPPNYGMYAKRVGKNLFSFDNIVSKAIYRANVKKMGDDPNAFYIGGASGATDNMTLLVGSWAYIGVWLNLKTVAETTFTVSCDVKNYLANCNGAVRVRYSDGDTQTGRASNLAGSARFNDVGTTHIELTVTIPANKLIQLEFSPASLASDVTIPQYTEVTNFQLEYGSQATDYEPYSGTVYPVSFGDAGTVYGGSLDVVSGTLTVTHTIVASNTASDYVRNNGTQYYLKAAAASGIKSPSAAEATVMSDRFKQVLSGASGVAYLNTGGNIRFNTADSYNTVQDMLDAIGTPQFLYPLATPLTYQLTPTQVSLLTGVNVISTDGNGDMTVTVTEPSLLVNPTLFESKPLLRIYGTGTVNINNQYITISAHSFPYIDIDCELMDAYYGSSNANQYVTFSDNDYITLKSGNNYIAYGNQIEVTPRWFEI